MTPAPIRDGATYPALVPDGDSPRDSFHMPGSEAWIVTPAAQIHISRMDNGQVRVTVFDKWAEEVFGETTTPVGAEDEL